VIGPTPRPDPLTVEGTVRRYRTEIIIPDDRYIVLQLPAEIPTGRARVTIQVDEADATDAADGATGFEDDIEWWDEFGEAPEGEEPWGLSVRLSALES
jgi:hypothetical protein